MLPKQKRAWGTVLFLAGILLALVTADSDTAGSLLGTGYLRTFATQTIDRRELFLTLLWERGRLVVILLLLCTGVCRCWMDKVIPALLCLLLGMYGGICLACQGLWGIGLFFLSGFPHGFLYLPGLYLLLHRKKPVQYSGKRYLFTEIVSVFMIAALFLSGCMLEAFVSSYLLQHYLLAFISAIS
jgi:hypothetical protein